MSNTPKLVTQDTPANMVLNAMLSDHVLYPCLCSMVYQLAESLQGSDDALGSDCWDQVNEILLGKADPGSVRRFAARHGRGWTEEAKSFYAALLYLIDEDEGRRMQYASLGTEDRHEFVKSRLWAAREMRVSQGIAL